MLASSGRFEVKGEAADVLVIDDYAHHPEEVRATLRAAREGVAQNGSRRIVALFQPHRYTRTRDLFDEFLSAFDDTDVLILSEIYPAGEDPIVGISGDMLSRALKKRGHVEVHFAPTKEELLGLTQSPCSRRVVMTLGAEISIAPAPRCLSCCAKEDHVRPELRDRLVSLLGERCALAVPLARYTSFRIGGPADVFIEPASVTELQAVMEVLYQDRTPYFLLGGGTNLLVSDMAYASSRSLGNAFLINIDGNRA